MPRLIAAVFLFMLSASSALADDWLTWRGPQMSGKAQETGFPLEWSDARGEQKNIKWKVELPAPGNSTPIVVGDKLLLTSQSDDDRARLLLCFNRADGSIAWQHKIDYNREDPTHNTNPHASASPVSDGKQVYAWFGSAGLFAFDLEGKLLWQRDLGQFTHIWGYASSPLVYEDLLILSAGPGLRAFVAAFDKNTGEEVWRFEPEDSISPKADEFRGSWSTPVVHHHEGTDYLLLSLPLRLYALAPSSGDVIWSSEGLSKLVYTSPLVENEVIVAMSGYGGPSMAVRAGGSGDVTETHRLWHLEEKNMNPQRVGSGLLVDGYVYILNEPGIAWCMNATTGEVQWRERLGSKSWCSMTLADGRLYVASEKGDTFVIAPNPKEFQLLAENPLGELMRASLAFSNREIFARTYQHLYCIGE